MNPETGRGQPKLGEDELPPAQTSSGCAGNQASSSEEVAETSFRTTFTSIPDPNERSVLKMKMPRPTTDLDQSLRVSLSEIKMHF